MKRMKLAWSFFVGLNVAWGSASALPTLQLDIGGGTYIGGTEESTLADTDAFWLYALMLPDKDSGLSSTYRVSAALYPHAPVNGDASDLGGFLFEGRQYQATPDLTWGTPPQALPGTAGVGSDLPGHGIFDTYFMEYDFTFDSTKQCTPYNVQTDIDDPNILPGSGLYYEDLYVDVSGLESGYGLHFDLYEIVVDTEKKGQQAWTYSVEAAPFSHDAASGTERGVSDHGATLSLMGASVLAIGGLGMRIKRKS